MGLFRLFLEKGGKEKAEVTDKDTMSLKTRGVPFANRVYTRRTRASEETKRVLSLAAEIKSINRATSYIKENGSAPPTTPNYYMKKLNSF